MKNSAKYTENRQKLSILNGQYLSKFLRHILIFSFVMMMIFNGEIVRNGKTKRQIFAKESQQTVDKDFGILRMQQLAEMNSVNKELFVELTELESLTKSYLGEKSNDRQVRQLLYGYLRTGRYESSYWNLLAGEVNQDFANYVLEKQTRDLSMIRKRKLEFFSDDGAEKQTVDFVHMMGTMNMIESGYGLVGGWAGDCVEFASVIKGICEEEQNATDSNELARKMLGTQESKMDFEDIYADIMAVNLAGRLKEQNQEAAAKVKSSESELTEKSFSKELGDYLVERNHEKECEDFLYEHFSETGLSGKEDLRTKLFSIYGKDFAVNTLAGQMMGNMSVHDIDYQKSAVFAFSDYLYENMKYDLMEHLIFPKEIEQGKLYNVSAYVRRLVFVDDLKVENSEKESMENDERKLIVNQNKFSTNEAPGSILNIKVSSEFANFEKVYEVKVVEKKSVTPTEAPKPTEAPTLENKPTMEPEKPLETETPMALETIKPTESYHPAQKGQESLSQSLNGSDELFKDFQKTKPVIKKIKKKKKTLEISWKKIKLAKSYFIYRRKGKSGTFRFYKTTKKTTITLKRGYDYKVKGYKKVDGKKYYTCFSNKIAGR